MIEENPRELPDWLNEFMKNADWGEAPQYFYFWVGVATIAAALRRRVWIDMGTFVWYPNLYSIFVAPAGIVQKGTTTDLGMRLLDEIPAIHQGPKTLTWQSLYDAFIEVGEEFEISQEETRTQSALYVNSDELGITLNCKDTDMIDQLTHMWDGKPLRKRTRMDGELIVKTPCLNLIGCTTPDWIAENVSKYLIGGGLTSRIIFIYGDKKARYVAYPQDIIPKDYKPRQATLIRDLERISNLVGPFTLLPDAKIWGTEWYENFHKNEAPKLDKTLVGGYIARKQTLVHKVAMVLSASRGDSLTITRENLERAARLVTELEEKMPLVYGKIGLSSDGMNIAKVLDFITREGDETGVEFSKLYRYMHQYYPDPERFELVLKGMIEAGYLEINRATRKVLRMRTA